MVTKYSYINLCLTLTLYQKLDPKLGIFLPHFKPLFKVCLLYTSDAADE